MNESYLQRPFMVTLLQKLNRNFLTAAITSLNFILLSKVNSVCLIQFSVTETSDSMDKTERKVTAVDSLVVNFEEGMQVVN